MANETNTWMTWTLGVLLTISMGTTAAIYSNLNNRVTNNEKIIEEVRKIAADPQMLINIAVLQVNMKETMESTARIEVRQEEFDKNMKTLLNLMSRSSVQYSTALREYQDLINDLKPKGKR